MLKKIKFGPGVFITSTLIGPGSVTLCLLGGVNTGMKLLWAVIIATIATISLQDMCVRLAYYSNNDLQSSISEKIKLPFLKFFASLVIFIGIIIGNMAYQGGYFAGSSLGIEMMELGINRDIILLSIFVFCLLCILKGSYQIIKKILIVIMLLMGISFSILAMMHLPNAADFLEGCLVPSFEKADLVFVLGFISIALACQNLFLHTVLIAHHEDLDIKSLRIDALLSVTFGGLISMAIVIIGSKAKGAGINNVQEMAIFMSNTGSIFSKYLLGLGLICAGLSSALTAPLLAGLVPTKLFAWKKEITSYHMKIMMVTVLFIGVVMAYTQNKNMYFTKLAHSINTALLPIFTIFLLWVLNDRALLKVHKNSTAQNLIGAGILIITIILAVNTINIIY